MTHTLHRFGSTKSLKDDYVVLIMKNRPSGRLKATSTGSSSDFAGNKLLKQLANKFSERNPRMRTTLKAMRWNIARVPKFPGPLREFEKSVLRSALPNTTVFNNKEELTVFLRGLRKLDIGQSVVVSGLFSEVNDSLKKINICPHTVEFSLGIFGNKALLPKEEVLQITTMCGHHLISPSLVEKLLYDIEKGRLTYEEAAKKMADRCFCGAFNIKRALRLMKAARAAKRAL